MYKVFALIIFFLLTQSLLSYAAPAIPVKDQLVIDELVNLNTTSNSILITQQQILTAVQSLQQINNQAFVDLQTFYTQLISFLTGCFTGIAFVLASLYKWGH